MSPPLLFASLLVLAAAVTGLGLAGAAYRQVLYPAGDTPAGTLLTTSSATSIDAATFAFEAPVSVRREFVQWQFNHTWTIKTHVTRWGNMRFAQVIVEPGVGITGNQWLDLSASKMTLDLGDADTMARRDASTMREQYFFRSNDKWHHGLAASNTFGWRLGRVRVDSASPGGYAWVGVPMTDSMIVNATFSVPSYFSSWPVATPSPLGRQT